MVDVLTFPACPFLTIEHGRIKETGRLAWWLDLHHPDGLCTVWWGDSRAAAVEAAREWAADGVLVRDDSGEVLQ